MNAPVSRRTLLGASAAAITAGALPALAEAGHPVSTAADLDTALFHLLDRWDPAWAAADVAGKRLEALWDVFVEQEPVRSEALHVRAGDSLGCGSSFERSADDRWTEVYDLSAVAKLRGMPLPTRFEETYRPHPDIPGDQIVHRRPVPDERSIARRAEVLAAHDAWMIECQAVKDRIGMDAADAAEEAAVDALIEIERKILATIPRTFAGLAAKARWATWSGLPKATAAIWTKRVAADVVALAERAGVAS